MWSRDNVPRPHQELLTPDDGAVTRLRLSSLGGRGRCSSRISLGHSCGLIANIDDLEWIVFWLSTTLSWLKLLRLNEWNDWWGCLCLQSKTKTFDKTDDTDFIQTRIYETEYLISVSTTPTFLQWSPNIYWLSTVTDLSCHQLKHFLLCSRSGADCQIAAPSLHLLWPGNSSQTSPQVRFTEISWRMTKVEILRYNINLNRVIFITKLIQDIHY